MADGRARKWSRENAAPHSSGDVSETDRTESRCFRHEVGYIGQRNSRKESGGLGAKDQCLGPQLALTAVHPEKMLLLDQTEPHTWRHPRPGDAQEG